MIGISINCVFNEIFINKELVRRLPVILKQLESEIAGISGNYKKQHKQCINKQLESHCRLSFHEEFVVNHLFLCIYAYYMHSRWLKYKSTLDVH